MPGEYATSGDFSAYEIARRGGQSIEQVPRLFGKETPGFIGHVNEGVSMPDDKPAVSKPVTSTVDHQSAADESAENKRAADEQKVVDARAAERKNGPKDSKVAPKKHVHHGKLAPAGASGDPVVQKALAELQTAQMNRRSLDVEEADVKAADAQVKAAQDALAELGYE